MINVNDAWELYWDNHVEQSVEAYARLKFAYKNIAPHFGNTKVNKITSAHVQNYIKKRKSGKIGRPSGDGTIRRELNALSAALNHCAKRERVIKKTDIPYIPLPKSPPPKDVVLSSDDVDIFLEKLEDYSKDSEARKRVLLFAKIAAETAARKSAIQELTWDQVDFRGELINFNPQGRHQTIKRRPIVPISTRLLPALLRAYQDRKTNFVIGHSGDVQKMFRAACDDIGYSQVTPHVLRHSWATSAAMAGVPMHQIASVMGDDEQTVRKNYLHFAPDYLRGAINYRSA